MVDIRNIVLTYDDDPTKGLDRIVGCTITQFMGFYEKYYSEFRSARESPKPTVAESPSAGDTASPAPQPIKTRNAEKVTIRGYNKGYKFFNPAFLPNGDLLARRVRKNIRTSKYHRKSFFWRWWSCLSSSRSGH